VGNGKDRVWIRSEENAGEKGTREEMQFVVSNRLRESRFWASGYDRKWTGLILVYLEDVGDDEEIVSVTKIEPREEDRIWESLKPSVQEVIEQGDYAYHERFLKSWKDAAEVYDGNPL
jgi:hypothetical protein